MKRLAVLFALLLFAGTAIIGLARAKSQSATAGFTAGTPINAAFYYPWFPETWHSADHFKPELGQYTSSNAAIRASHIAMLKYAGIQAGVLSWWGQRTKTDSRLAGYLNAGAAQRFPQTVYYEKEGIGDPSVQDIRSDLTYLRKYADQPDGAWLHVDGRPVIFVYGDGGESCATASRWAAATAGTSWYVVLKVFRGYLTCHDQPASWHQYGPAVSEDTQPKYSMSISPGFWKYDESTPRLPRDPTRWARNVADLKVFTGQWRLVATFNEWGEGTAIEPSSSWSSPSGFGTYIDELHRQLVENAPPSTIASPSQPVTSTTTPGTSTSSSIPTTTNTTKPPASTTTTATPTAASGTLPRPDHTVVVIFENHSYGEVIGSSSAPYINALASQGATFSQSFAVTHPSEPNYLAIFSGSTQGVSSDTCPVNFSAANLGSQLIGAGLSFAGYSEGIPSAGYTGCSSGEYARKHNPWADFSNVPASANQAFTSWPTDFSTLPKVSFVVPNLCDDMHDCSVATGDTWLKNHLDSYVQWAKTHNSLLIVTFDEDDFSTINQIPTIFVGPMVRAAVYGERIDHYRVLRTIEGMYGLPGIANAAAMTPIGDVWTG